jgi:hypothetical protein
MILKGIYGIIRKEGCEKTIRGRCRFGFKRRKLQTE